MNRLMKFLSIAALAAVVLSGCAPAAATAPAETQNPNCLGTADKAIVDLKCQKITIAVENLLLNSCIMGLIQRQDQ